MFYLPRNLVEKDLFPFTVKVLLRIFAWPSSAGVVELWKCFKLED